MKVELKLRDQVAEQAVEINSLKEDQKLLLLACRTLLASMDRTPLDRRAAVELAEGITERIGRNRLD